MHYCGIDVAKKSHVVTVIDERGEVVKPSFTVTNDRAGFDQLIGLLAPFDGQVRVGLESTGHYWLSLFDTLSQEGYGVVVINPLQVRAYRKTDIRKRKTDSWDAYWVADFMRHRNPSPSELNLPVILQLRELTRFRHRLTEQIGDCKRKILSALDRVFPEYESLFSDVFLATSRELLRGAVAAAEFAEFDLAELEAIVVRSSRGRFGREKARQIQAVARKSVGVSFLTDAIGVEVRCLLAQIDLLQSQRAEVDEAIQGLMDQIPQHITTIPGIGPVTGAALLAEIGDVERFPGPEKLVAYAGIDASVHETGQFKGDQAHMSKRGSPYLRCALWQAAVASLLHNAEMKAYYDKKRAEGKPHGVAVGAVCRRLLGRIYVILKEQRPYVIR